MGYYYLGLDVNTLCIIYSKSKSTIYSWIQRWEDHRSTEKFQIVNRVRKFDSSKIAYIIEIFTKNPTMFLDEAKSKFMEMFRVTISISSIWNILINAGFTNQSVQRRAIMRT